MSIGIQEILDQCHEVGVKLDLADDREHLFLHPAERLTNKLVELMKQNKMALLLWLKMEPEKWKTVCHEDGRVDLVRFGDGDINRPKPAESGIYVAVTTEEEPPFDDLPELKFCPKCGGCQWWQSLAKTWHCQTCDPPSDHAKRFVYAAAAIREWYQTRATPLHGSSLAKLLRMASKRSHAARQSLF